MNAILILIIIALKFIIPVLVAIFPFSAGWANFVLDTIDGDLLIPLGLEDPTYQPVDKFADLLTYVGMVFAAWRYDWKIKQWIYVLFAVRVVGQIAFFLTNNEAVFFYFPNFLEPLFLIYASLLFFRKKKVTESIWERYKIPILIFVFIYKMQDEYFTHIGNVDRSDFIQDLFSYIG